MVTITRLPEGAPGEVAVALERVVRELLGDAGEELEVRFGTWPDEDGRFQYVCRVEGAPADPFAIGPQWRWWSPLFDGPEALRQALSTAVRARRSRGVGRPAADHAEPAAARSF